MERSEGEVLIFIVSPLSYFPIFLPVLATAPQVETLQKKQLPLPEWSTLKAETPNFDTKLQHTRTPTVR